MTGCTLECAVLALEAFAVHFIACITAIVFMIATPSTRYAFAVSASEFRLGTLAEVTLADCVRFVGAVATVVSEVTGPLPKFSIYYKTTISI